MWADAEGRRNVDEEERGSDSKTQRKQAWRATAWEHPHPHPPPSLGSPCSSSWAPPLGDGRDSPPNTCRLAQGPRAGDSPACSSLCVCSQSLCWNLLTTCFKFTWRSPPQVERTGRVFPISALFSNNTLCGGNLRDHRVDLKGHIITFSP